MDTNKQKEAVVIISGGMDSVTLLYQVIAWGYKVHALSFDYGQKHKKELEYAKTQCEAVGADHIIVDLSPLNALLKSALTDKDIEVPEGHYAAENMKATVVPNRNSIMLAIAVGHAVSLNAQRVFAGMHSGDHPIYPDCRPEFVEAFNKAEVLANKGYMHPDFMIEAPFINISKADIAKKGLNLGIDYSGTWSCYKGGEKHCGKCGTCVERKEAFQLIGAIDTTEYEA